jgi:hypothetical protein
MYQVKIGYSRNGRTIFGHHFVYCESLDGVSQSVNKTFYEYRDLGNIGIYKNARVYKYDEEKNKPVGASLMFISASEMRSLLSSRI